MLYGTTKAKGYTPVEAPVSPAQFSFASSSLNLNLTNYIVINRYTVSPLSTPVSTVYILTTNALHPTASNTPSTTRYTTPVATPLYPPWLTPQPGNPVVKTIHHILDLEYSSTRPEFVFHGGCGKFGDVNLVSIAAFPPERSSHRHLCLQSNPGLGSAAQPGTGACGSTTIFNP